MTNSAQSGGRAADLDETFSRPGVAGNLSSTPFPCSRRATTVITTAVDCSAAFMLKSSKIMRRFTDVRVLFQMAKIPFLCALIFIILEFNF